MVQANKQINHQKKKRFKIGFNFHLARQFFSDITQGNSLINIVLHATLACYG
jgi:hypothetical protein